MKNSKSRGDDDEFAMGVEVEMEHANTIRAFIPRADEETVRKVAASIAEDHLKEDPKYYTKLIKMEKGKKAAPADARDGRNEL